jgi:uncharacterized repeat protein (TIGR03803 family)
MKKIYTLILALIVSINSFGQYTKLLDFASVANGSRPYGDLYFDGTYLYGLSNIGGANNLGTFFKILPNGTGFVKLLDFAGATNGSNPMGPLISDGTFLYGMTYNGGTNSAGTIFKILPNGTGYVKLLDFAGVSNGANPQGSLYYDGTYLYGMTNAGGTNGFGVIFKILPNGTGYVKLLDFAGVTNGRGPVAALISDGTFLYGTTEIGGTNGMGVIFKILPNGTGYVKLLDFAGATNGNTAEGTLYYDGTFLYGMTRTGGANNMGVVYKILPNGTGFTKLFDFSGTIDGQQPFGSLAFDGTYLYGLTSGGGANALGVLFKILTNGTGYVKLLDFAGATNGRTSFGCSLIVSAPYLYGMTTFGGTNDIGTIFKYQYCNPPGNPGLISGNTSVCLGTNQSYSIAVVAGATSYSWSLPGGWTGTSTTNIISATPGSTGVFSITAINSCVTSLQQTLSITVNTQPTISANSGSICSGSSFTIVPSGANTYTIQGGSSVVSPTTTSSYTVTGTSTAGCVSASSATSNITVNVLPTVAVNSGSICSGQTFTMVPSGANTYTFQGGSATVNPASTTSYTVVGTSTAGCVSASPATSNVTVNPTPTITVNSGAFCAGSSFTMVPSGASTYTFQGGSAVVSPTANTSYTVTGTSTAGCVSTSAATSSVTYLPNPTVTVSGSQTITCASPTATINAGGASSYTWSGTGIVTGSNSAVATVNQPNTYSVVGSVAGCTSNIGLVTVTSNTTTPSVTANTSNSIICGPPFQGTATLTGIGANTYTWNPGGAGTSISVSPSVTTQYTLTGTNSANGCTNTTVFTQSVSTCTGLNQISNSVSELNIYPNPFSNKITIVSDRATTVQIFNVIGSLVFSSETESNKTEIDLSEQANGIYFVKISENNQVTKTGKIIKQ